MSELDEKQRPLMNGWVKALVSCAHLAIAPITDGFSLDQTVSKIRSCCECSKGTACTISDPKQSDQSSWVLSPGVELDPAIYHCCYGRGDRSGYASWWTFLLFTTAAQLVSRRSGLVVVR
jgi:hypothetical protein